MSSGNNCLKDSFRSKYILVAIDGTKSRHEYEKTRKKSYVRKFYEGFETSIDQKIYLHGPDDIAGFDCSSIISQAVQFIENCILKIKIDALKGKIILKPEPGSNTPFFKSGFNRIDHVLMKLPESFKIIIPDSPLIPDIKICLIGHSRGGLVAINVAKYLKIPVFFLGLYDAVDMHLFLSGGKIRNVKNTYHVQRDPKVGSRRGWGNTGTSSSGKYLSISYSASHGALGGKVDKDPLSIFTDDFSCKYREFKCEQEAKQADQLIRKMARLKGLPISSFPYQSEGTFLQDYVNIKK